MRSEKEIRKEIDNCQELIKLSQESIKYNQIRIKNLLWVLHLQQGLLIEEKPKEIRKIPQKPKKYVKQAEEVIKILDIKKPEKKAKPIIEGTIECPRCNSKNIGKGGFKIREDGTKVRRYRCKDCNRKFIDPEQRIHKKRVEIKQKVEKKPKKPQPRPDRKEIIKFIQTKEHTLKEIQEEFKFPTITSVYYWLSQAKVSVRDLPKKVKLELEEEEDFDDPNEFSDV